MSSSVAVSVEASVLCGSVVVATSAVSTVCVLGSSLVESSESSCASSSGGVMEASILSVGVLFSKSAEARCAGTVGIRALLLATISLLATVVLVAVGLIKGTVGMVVVGVKAVTVAGATDDARAMTAVATVATPALEVRSLCSDGKD